MPNQEILIKLIIQQLNVELVGTMLYTSFDGHWNQKVIWGLFT